MATPNKNVINLAFIKERRTQMKISMREAAKRLGLKSASHYYKYEDGEYPMRAYMLPPIAAMLMCNILDLFDVPDKFSNLNR